MKDLPIIGIFTQNYYKKNKFSEIKPEQMKQIITLNSFPKTIDNGKHKNEYIYGLRSFLNHSKYPNIEGNSDIISLNYAKDDIPKGSQLTIDYCFPITDPEKRNSYLQKYGIQEEIDQNLTNNLYD